MELMDWKNIERESNSQIINANVQIVIAKVLLKEALKNIKKLEVEE